MQKGLLPDLLKTLSAKEKTAFLAYVQSPHLGAKAEVVRLAQQLCHSRREPVRVTDSVTEHATSATSKSAKATAFPHLFPTHPTYDDAKMRKVMEQLLRLLERFLVHQHREADAFDHRLRLAAVFAERKQEKLLRRLLEADLPLAQGSTLCPADERDWTATHFEQAAAWLQLRYDYRAATQREHDPALYERIVQYQTTALLARRLHRACIFRSNQKEKGLTPSDPILEAYAANQSTNQPLLQTLFAAWRCLHEPNAPQAAAHFALFRDGLLAHPHCFPPADRRELLLVAINFCSRRYNAGDPAWLDTQLDLYDHGLRDGLLLDERGWVTGYTFTNIATLALIGRRLERLAHLLRDFRDKIAPRDRLDTVAFNEARLHHARREYQPALRLLQQNVFDDLLLNLSAKTIQAKCFYELQEHDLLEAHLEALRKFIRRHKEVGYYGERYLNFIAVLRRLVRTRAEERPALRREVEGMAVLAEKEWLLGV